MLARHRLLKSEGVIPARELSIRKGCRSSGEIVALGDEIEALVLQKEDATAA